MNIPTEMGTRNTTGQSKEDPKTGAKTPNLPGLRDHNEYGKGVILPATIREDAGNRDLHHDQLSDLFRNESGEIY
jgi:hypothetical protein